VTRVTVGFAGLDLTAGEGDRSGTLTAEATFVNVTSAFVSGFTILMAEDFLGRTNGEGSSLGAGEGVAGGCCCCCCCCNAAVMGGATG